MNLQTLRAKLTRVERQRSKLELQIKTGSRKQFDALPGKVGLKSIDELILELMPYASPRVRAKVGLNGHGAAAPAAARVGRGKRSVAEKSTGTRYTEDTKQAIKQALEKGGLTVAQISEKFGASSFSINQWKKRWGLTKARKKK